MTELIELVGPRREAKASYMTVDINGRIYLSAELVLRIGLEAGMCISFLCSPDGSHFWIKTYLGKTLLRGLPSRKMLVCYNLAFSQKIFQKSEGNNLQKLRRFRVATTPSENGFYEIMYKHQI